MRSAACAETGARFELGAADGDCCMGGLAEAGWPGAFQRVTSIAAAYKDLLKRAGGDACITVSLLGAALERCQAFWASIRTGTHTRTHLPSLLARRRTRR